MKFMNELKQLPQELLNLKEPVQRLYFRGNLELLNRRKVAIIGSRKMSVYTKNCVFELARLLKSAGVVVVSGGALGVDIAAHEGAMPSTIGVFANGLDEIYPKINEKIIRDIYTQGLALSENEPKYLPTKYDFLLRNRIIIALCEAIIVAQADFKSGSLHSANLAVKLGKMVFVLPQRRGESDGTNALLEQGKVRLISDFKAFAASFGQLNLDLSTPQSEDALLKYCKNGVSLNEALAKFGDKIYEYELEGKIEIQGITVRAKF